MCSCLVFMYSVEASELAQQNQSVFHRLLADKAFIAIAIAI